MGKFSIGSLEWLEALDYPEQDRAEIKRNRKVAIEAGIVESDAARNAAADIRRNRMMSTEASLVARDAARKDDADNALARKTALDAISQEYGDWTYVNPTTVIAGGKKHNVPAGTAYKSAPSQWEVHQGPRGGWYRRTKSGGKSYF